MGGIQFNEGRGRLSGCLRSGENQDNRICKHEYFAQPVTDHGNGTHYLGEHWVELCGLEYCWLEYGRMEHRGLEYSRMEHCGLEYRLLGPIMHLVQILFRTR